MDHAWDDTALDAAIAELEEHRISPARTILAEARTQPETRSLRVEVLAGRLVGLGGQVLSLAMDSVDPELSLLAGAVAIAEAQVIADGATDSNAARVAHAYLRRALGPLNQAAELVDTDPVPHDLLQTVTSATNRAECDKAWERAVKRGPTLFSAHRARVEILDPVKALAFARATARSAGSGDPRIALVVLAHFRVHAGLEAAFRASGKAADRRAMWDYFGGAVRDEVAALSQRFLAAARPHPRTVEAHNLFAAAFTRMYEYSLAEPHLAAVAGRPSGWAWSFVGGAKAYDRAVRRHVRNVPADRPRP
ncbi:hypothetical protein [Actinokineospora fastidiosa]|uniref:Uncharacterized protein n=1 Tax=Actinokineospora fastidiosa TaxID=1816 RepID=A0A918GLC1_9PSEU|nr:hypothetical protein [Actinokineospora fastidiosa]GGS42758.1 hypothetical protein GCM10010171_42230 [Actinokineospora fastidiosa]